MDQISREWLKFFQTLNESQKRWFAAVKSLELGRCGISLVSQATGLSRTTITKGVKEIKSSKKNLESERVRSIGGGRHTLIDSDSKLLNDLEEILSETTAGDPMSFIRWTGLSVRKISERLSKKGHPVSRSTIHRLLEYQGYSLQSNRKSLSRADDPDRDRQFKLINRKVSRFMKEDNPVISVDTKKKENVGSFKNAGRSWRQKGDPILVEDHDFLSRGIGKAIPYGTYDVYRNEGLVNIGISCDTAEFAVNSILRWWLQFGKKSYENSNKILICADGGGSNGSTNRLWKYSLQNFCKKTGLEVHVCHYPPGTSKWNKIEHRMFSYISSHWKGQPLKSYETIINLIGSTTTKNGLKIKARLDKREYRTGKKVSEDDLSQLKIIKNKTFPKWNYSIIPD